LSLASSACGDKATSTGDAKGESGDNKKDGKDNKSAAPKGSAAASAPVSATASAPAKPADAPATGAGSDALAHLPASCDVAVALDLAKVAKHPAVAAEIVPRLEAMLKTENPKDDSFKRMQGFMTDTGLTLSSLKSVGVCARMEGGGEPKVLALLGGDFKPDTFVTALEKHKKPGKETTLSEIDGIKVTSDGKMFLGQFSDGVLAGAESVDTFKTAIKPGDNASKFMIDRSKEVSLYLSKNLIKTQFIKKGNALFEELDEAYGSVDLTTGKIMLTLKTPSAESAKKVDSYFIVGKDAFLKDGKVPAQFGAVDAVKSMTTKVDGSNVVVELAFPAASITDAVKFLGAQLEAEKGKL
jgi:hypothetical protein